MEAKGGKLSRIGVGVMVLLLVLMMAVYSEVAMACPSGDDRSGCAECIADRFTGNCPACVPIMRCMARCLWGGSSRNKCIKKCDCNSDYPKLADCKKCLSHCKCRCSSY